MAIVKDRNGNDVDLEKLGEQSLDDVDRLFDGKWVLMRVTEVSQYDAPARGYVVAVEDKRNDIQDVTFACLKTAREQGERYTLYPAADPARVDELNRWILEESLRSGPRRESKH